MGYFQKSGIFSAPSVQCLNLTRNRTIFSVLDRPRKSSTKILQNSSRSENIAIFVYHMDQLSCPENLKEFYFGPKIEWSDLTRTDF